MSHKSDAEIVGTTHNTARFFTENRHISWVLLIATILWGVFGYARMPKLKDPDVPVRVALARCAWPGASAEKVEELVTRKIEQKMAENPKVAKIESYSRNSISLVYVELHESTIERAKEFDDIKMKLDSIHELPDGAGPVEFVKDFGDTAALMLTVASPKASEVEVELRAANLRQAIEKARAAAPPVARGERFSIASCLPGSVPTSISERRIDQILRYVTKEDFGRNLIPLRSAGCIGVDVEGESTDEAILGYAAKFVRERLRASEIHPDVWPTLVIRDPATTKQRFAAVAGDRYTYRELDDATDLIQRTLQTIPEVSKVTRAGILSERIYLDYSQERLAAYGLQAAKLKDLFSARNITMPGGFLEVGAKNISIDPSGEFRSEREIGDLLISTTSSGSPVYLRDLVEITREYDSPPRYLNFYAYRDPSGAWVRSRAVTLAVQMRPGQQIGSFGESVDSVLEALRTRLPEGLILARTSDQPRQVEEIVGLFMDSLYEAIALVVIVALIGFWEWRSALLMALSIPITLAMTYGMMDVLGIDLQQISIGSMIIALGLLVDDPVVAGDAIKRSLAAGHPRVVAAWLGPTKLAAAIMFATITNIVAYLPMLLISGDTGRFLYSLPVVLACSLVASRLVSMTFIPLLGYYLLRPDKETPEQAEAKRSRGFPGWYRRVGTAALRHRWAVLAGSLLFLVAGGVVLGRLKSQFFPNDLSYLSYVDVWLPEGSTLTATNDTAMQAEALVREAADAYGSEHAPKDGSPKSVLRSLTTFVGGGGPRFWFSVSPEQQQLNYAQILIEVNDKHDTPHLIGRLQRELSARIAGARIDVRALENGKPVGTPISVRISGEDSATLRAEAEKVKDVYRAVPTAQRTYDNWGEENFTVKLLVDPDRANLAGISNLDVALSSAAGMSGFQLTSLREGEDMIPVVGRLRMEERAQLADVQNLYVYGSSNPARVPLRQISKIDYAMVTEKTYRRNQFKTITIGCFPADGVLASEVFQAVKPGIDRIAAGLPPGYRLEIGGEYEEQVKGFKELAIVLLISIACIYMALVIQFRNAVKPLIVFAAIPYGMVGAFTMLWLMGSPFGFMAFLGVVSLVGVIVSHVIVLFDFIEEAHQKGEPLEQALLDAGIVRLRPVLITVGATVFGLVPLVWHGGPLWEPLCYAQIGGLAVATVITLLMVPVLYAIAVRDLKIVRWERPAEHA